MQLLADPPTNDENLYRRRVELERWKDWFSDVEAGRRSFRFKGDPREWTLEGPLKESSTFADRQRVRRDPMPPGDNEPQDESEGKVTQMHWTVVIVLTIALVTGLAIFLKRTGASG